MCIALAVTVGMLHSAQQQRDEAKYSLGQAKEREDSLRKTLDLQRDLYNDARKTNDEYWNRVKTAESESSRLADDLRSGSRRLSVNATCLPAASPVSGAFSGTDGAAPRLNASAERDYLSLSAGIKKQFAQIVGLQAELKSCLRGRAQ